MQKGIDFYEWKWRRPWLFQICRDCRFYKTPKCADIVYIYTGIPDYIYDVQRACRYFSVSKSGKRFHRNEPFKPFSWTGWDGGFRHES